MKKVLAVIAVIIVAAVIWLAANPDWRKLLASPPTGNDVLFWTQEQRDAGFRMMDRLPFIIRARTAKTADPKALASGPALDLSMDLQAYVDSQLHAGLVILHNGQIRAEFYGLDFDASGRWTSFSVAKSFTSTLVGAAIKDGYIDSLDSNVTAYIEGLRGSAYDGVTVEQLLTMTSGIAWNEDYEDPDSDVAKFLNHRSDGSMPDLVSYMRELPRAHPPGEVWNYSTGETNLIGILVSSATGQTLTDYLEDKVWQTIGMQQSGSWLIGEDGHEVSGCCIQAATRDYARFGHFILNGARVNGESIVPDDWIARATTTQAQTPMAGEGYGYQWWTYDDGTYAARGIFGQGIFIDPQRKLVIALNSSWSSALGARGGENQAREDFYRRVQEAIDAETLSQRVVTPD